MKKYITFSVLLVLFSLTLTCTAQKNTNITNNTSTDKTKSSDQAFNFVIVSDWGWSGEKFQQQVADQMAKTVDSVHAKFIVSCGDNFQIAGVASTHDPLWLTNFESVYKAPSLQIDWYPVLGNHDYKGNTKAQIDYSKLSSRWHMPDRNYTFAKKINDSISARFIFLDTAPFCDKYQKSREEYPDMANIDTAKEIKWLDDVLANAKEQWILVFGHHPVYSASKTHGNTPEMIERVKPLLEKYHAQFYFCGHDHDMQHLREKGSNVDYIVTGAGGEPRPSSSNGMSIFSHSEPGFSVVSMKADSLKLSFVGVKGGNIIYNYNRSYK